MNELTLAQFALYLQPRARDAHKGSFGHVLIVGGDYGYSGATLLAAEAALRVGAGLVSIATRSEHAKVLNLARPEVMCHGIEMPKQLVALLAKATVVVIGPGLGQTSWGQSLFDCVMESALPMLVDADGLNQLAEKQHKKNHWVLTPHPGEAGRLLKMDAQAIQNNRIGAVQQLQQQYGGWVVLKGAGSLIAGPDLSVEVCQAGNPGMATGGMGDVLSGVVAGLIAQPIPFNIAVKIGVIVHAMAADLAAKNGERGMIATDLMPFLRRVVNIS